MPPMAIDVPRREQRFLTWIDWAGYLRCREALDESGVRITFDRGRMELMSPSPEHEQGKSDLGCALEVWLQEHGVDYSVGGNPTMRKESAEQGLEPDECYYLGTNAGGRLGPAPAGLNMNPPDLVLEIEVTRSALNRLAIFDGLGIPEVWRYGYDTGRLHVHVRTPEGGYLEAASSALLPDLPVQALAQFVQRGREVITSQLLREVREWARALGPGA